MNNCSACHRPLSVTTQICSNCGQKRVPSTVHPAVKVQPPHRPRPIRQQLSPSMVEPAPAAPHEVISLQAVGKGPVPGAPRQSGWQEMAFSNRPTEVDIPIQGRAQSSLTQEVFPSSFISPISTPPQKEQAPVFIIGTGAEDPGAPTSAFESLQEPPFVRKKQQEVPVPAAQKLQGAPASRKKLSEESKTETNTFATLQQNPERIYATKRAAEHWRNSWIDRQRLEAGPATDVVRGQALVEEPLNIIQQSLLRMRAVLHQQDERKQKSNTALYWLQVIGLSITILALTGFILASYF